eukprot:353153_1
MMKQAKQSDDSKETEESDDPQLQLARKLFPRYKKHSLIPIITSIAGLGAFAIACLIIDKKYYNNFRMFKLSKLGWFLLSYLIGIFLIRIKVSKTTSVCFELLWGCNLGLLFSAIGCILGRPLLIGISIGLVGLDQTIWYMDICSFLLRRKYLIGAAGYLSNPEQTFLRSITSLHHLWFLPVTMSCLYIGKSYLHKHSFPLSMFIGFLSMIYGRICIPKLIWCPLTKAVKQRIDRIGKSNKTKHTGSFNCMVDYNNEYYLEYFNVNCGHEFYPTVSIGFLHTMNSSPIYVYLPIIAALLTGFSYVPFYLMTKVSDKYLFIPSSVS